MIKRLMTQTYHLYIYVLRIATSKQSQGSHCHPNIDTGGPTDLEFQAIQKQDKKMYFKQSPTQESNVAISPLPLDTVLLPNHMF